MQDVSAKTSGMDRRVVGLDVGDRKTHVCELSTASGDVLAESSMTTTRDSVRAFFEGKERMRVVLEVGKQSPWMSHLIARFGHEVLVANARKVSLIFKTRRKRDRVDAQKLARLGRVDPELLYPIQHRGEEAQHDLSILRSRECVIASRTKLINHTRGVAKSSGYRLPKCDAKCFANRMRGAIPEPLRPALDPVVEMIGALTQTIKAYNKQLEELAKTKYAQSELLTRIHGVGLITSMAFLLVIDDPKRFQKSRTVGAYLGLVPALDDSGDCHRQLHISKEGDRLLRGVLLQSAHYMMGPFGKDCDLRRHGERIVAAGGERAKRRAVVAVARKIAVLLHRLWLHGEDYDPFFNSADAVEAA